MTFETLLRQLKQQNIPIRLKDDKLFIAAKKQQISAELLTQVKKHKERLLSYLQDIERKKTAAKDQIVRTKRQQYMPLSFAQQRMWLLEQLEGGSTYLMPGALTLAGSLDVAALELSFGDLAARHEALRTSFMEKDETPSQHIAEAVEFKLAYTDLTGSPTQQAELAELITANAGEGFDLSQAPLFRARVVKLNDTEHVLLYALHHIIGDEWSGQLLISELSQAYQSRLSGQAPSWPMLAVQYVDYAVWQRDWLQGEVLAEQLAYWREQLGEQHPVLELPTDYPRPATQSFAGDRVDFDVPVGLGQALQVFCREQGFTLFQLLLGSFQLLLAKYSGQQEVRVGVPIANRTRGEMEGVVGCFINTQVLTLNLTETSSVLSALNQVKTRAIGAQAHQDIPFEKLVEALNVPRNLSHSPLFQVMFNLQQAAVGQQALTLDGLTLTPLQGKQQSAKFDLTLDMTEQDGVLRGSLEYCTALFGEEKVRQIIRHYIHLLGEVMSQPNTLLNNLQLLDKTEQAQLEQVETLAADYDLTRSWLTRFSEQVNANPNAVTVTDSRGEMTLRELDNLSSQVAANLQRTGIKPDDVVAVLAERNREFIVSLVGILKVGAAWLPLSPSQPPARWQQVLNEAGIKAVLVDKKHLAEADEHLAPAHPVLPYASLLEKGAALTPVAEYPGQLAYVLFTSGSTGKPKGVMVSREGMLNNMLAKVSPLGLSEQDVIGQTAGQCFDISVWQMLTAPALGACVHIVEEDTVRDPDALTRVLNQQRVSIAELVPSLMDALLETQAISLAALRWVLPTGEALPPGLVRNWFNQYPDIPLMNAYGPAECADDVAFAPLYNAPADTVVNMPIGLPTANAVLYVVDGGLNRVPTGVVGELAVGGVGVGRGYRQDPGRTAPVFVPNPFSGDGERLYLTGDLVKRLTDGNLEYIGRKDFQVKIRGQRIELGEIEAALVQLPQVNQAVVTAVDATHLVAYISGESVSSDAELKDKLTELLPGYMVPSLIIPLEKLPLNSNGKVDRKALPAPDFSALQQVYEAPETETERQLAQIWQDLLQVECVGRRDNFFELGGHSLLATRLVSQVVRKLGKQLALKTVFEAPLLSAQANALIESGSDDLPAIVKVARHEHMPLSFAQQRMWLLEQLEGGSTYLMPGALTLAGSLDVAALELSFGDLAARHEALRTSFMEKDETPSQHIAEAVEFKLAYTDLTGSPTQQAELAELITANAGEGFDLSQAPLFRARVVKLNDTEHVLLYALHHIIGDEWSGQLLISELSQAYQSRLSGQVPSWPMLAVQYVDYAVWQRDWLQGAVLAEQLAYWREQLGEQHPVLELPTDYPRPAAQSFAGDRVDFDVPVGLGQALQTFCREQGFTLFQLLLGSFQLLLAKYSGQQEVRVGVPIANRTRGEMEGVVGCFINTQVLTLNLAESTSVLSALNQVKTRAIGAQTHQDIPFEKLVEALNVPRDLSHSPLFQVMFNLKQAAVGEQVLTLDGLTLTPLQGKQQSAKFDLTLDMAEQDGVLRGSLEYCTALFSEETVKRITAHYLYLLELVMSKPDVPLSQISLVSQAEISLLSQGWRRALARVELNQDMVQLFEQQVAAQPGKIAASFAQSSLSYQALNEKANQLAHWLMAQGVGTDTLVAQCTEREPWMLISLLAIQKAGGAYVPLDPHHPKARIQAVLNQAKPLLVLTSSAAKGAIPAGINAVELEGLLTELEQQPTTNPAGFVSHQQLAYTLFTSGSTGKPKGVQISRGAFVNHLHSMQAILDTGAGDKWLAVASITFDAAGFELFLPLTQGAQVIIANRGQTLDADVLLKLMERHNISVMQATPATWQFLVEKESSRWQGLTAVSGGEALPAKLAEKLLTRGVHLLNAYGPTEATVNSATKWILDSDIAIGNAPLNYQLYVLDEDLNPVPQGVQGELYIGGLGLARGYMGRVDLTAQSFIPNPFALGTQNETGGAGSRLYRSGDLVRSRGDGSLDYLGRSDFQVKVRGFRIELGEIEGVIEQAEQVSRAVVVSLDERMVAYVTLAQGTTCDNGVLLTGLRSQLPDYMVPSLIIQLEKLPLNSNGKVDRKALPAPDFSALQQEYEAPETETERQLAQIWQDLLQVEQVGRRDNFFELGGHSLLATRLVSQVRSALDRELPLKAVFEVPMLMALAKRLETESGRRQPAIVRVSRQQDLPLSFAQQRLWIIDQMSDTSSAYNMTSALAIKGDLDLALLESAFTQLVARHEILRTSYQEVQGEPIQVIHQKGVFPLIVEDLHSLAAGVKQDKVNYFIQQNEKQPFDLSAKLMLRAKVLVLGEGEYTLLLGTHHIATDGWSMGIMTDELTSIYQSLRLGRKPVLPELALQYADYAVWQRDWLQGDVLSQQLNFWRTQMAGCPPLVKLPLDFPRPKQQSHDGGACKIQLPKVLVTGLSDLANEHGCTLFMLLLAGFKLALSRTVGSKDIVIGTDLAGRNDSALEQLIGFFINVLPLRTRINDGDTFVELLRQVKTNTLAAYEHQDLPFDLLVDALRPKREPSYNPVVQALFVMQNLPQGKLNLPGVSFENIAEHTQESKFDLAIFVKEGKKELTVECVYTKALFKRPTIQNLLAAFRFILEQSLSEPTKRINAFELFNESERKQMAIEKTKRKGNKLGKLKKAKPQATTTSSLVKTALLEEGKVFPVVVRPAVADLDACAWAEGNRDYIQSLLNRHAGILFRDFPLKTPQEFESFAQAIFPGLYGDYGDLPKKEGGKKTYKSTPYPEQQMILYHNESSHLHKWPRKQWFFSEIVAPIGGATPIVDCREMYKQMPSEIIQKLEQKQLLYVRNFTDQLDVSWQDFFKTESKREVEDKCRAEGMEFEWLGENQLQTRTLCPAVISHPVTGEKSFFNQVQLHHIYWLDREVRENLLEMVGLSKMPRNVYYGDGSPIEDSVMETIGRLYEECAVRFQWQQGDLVMVDNMLAAHARDPFEGPRKIVVAMGDMYSRQELENAVSE